MAVTRFTPATRKEVESRSPRALPNRPSDKGWTGDQVRKYLYAAILMIYDLLKVHVDEVADILDGEGGIEEKVSRLLSYFDVNGIANKAKSDGEGNVISTTYETKGDATNKLNTALAQLNALITALANGTNIPARAKGDESGNTIKTTYGASLSHSLTGGENQWTLSISLVDKNGNVLDTETQVLGSASSIAAGLMSVADKLKVDAIASDIATALNSAKAYADNLVLRTNLVSVLGEASTSLNGLMSADDKAHLEALYALLGDSSDADSVVDTINEVLAIFNQYPEGADLVSALALKVNISDIVDDLVTENAGKPLSAKQGKVLKGLIDTLTSTKANASDVYAKGETYSQSQANDKFRTESQVDDQIDEKLANVSALNVIADEDDNKNYTYQIKIQNGEAHFIATEVE